MRTAVACLVALGLKLLAVLYQVAPAQPVGAPVAPVPAAEAPPPAVVPAVPVEAPPAAAAAGAPTPEPTPEDKRRAEVSRWVAGRGYPPWTVEYLERHEAAGLVLAAGLIFAKPLIFVAAMLVVGLGLSEMLRNTMVPRAPGAMEQRTAASPRQAAIAALIGWSVAFIIASELIGLTWFGAVMSGVGSLLGGVARLLGSLLSFVVWVGVVAVIAYAAGAPSREFILSLLGFYYLRHHPKRPGRDEVFDLGGGKVGRVESVDLFQTTFSVDGGGQETRPNAWLMHGHFKWGVAAQQETPKG